MLFLLFALNRRLEIHCSSTLSWILASETLCTLAKTFFPADTCKTSTLHLIPMLKFRHEACLRGHCQESNSKLRGV